MYLYHGSDIAVTTVDYKKSRTSADFGTGFYTTNIKEQAIIWAKRIAISHMGKEYNPEIKAVVTTFNLDNKIFKDTKIRYRRFRGASETYGLVARNNLVGDKNTKGDHNKDFRYDLVSGYMATAELISILNNYDKGEIDKETFRMYLKSTLKNNQYSFHSKRSTKYLKSPIYEYFDITQEDFNKARNTGNIIELKFFIYNENNGVSLKSIVLNLEDILNNKIQWF